MKGLYLQTVIDFIIAINWRSAGSVLFGAFISALISYRFTKWRENQRLKIDLQVKTADLLIDTVKTFNTAAARMTSPNLAFFQNYNTSLQYNQIAGSETNDPFDATRITNELHLSQIEHAKEKVRKNFDDYNEMWLDYSNAFFMIISILESKEVILNKFIGFRYLLLDKFRKLGEMQNDFVTLYQCDINQSLIHLQPITEVCLQKSDEHQQKLMEKCMDISCIMWDLQVGLQNKFLSKLFDYKVPERQPQDKALPVYKPGFVYNIKKDNNVSN